MASKILVVDDEQSICWGLTRLGESLGHTVATAASAEEALQVVERFEPDVIILDVRLPGMDGLAAIEKLQEKCGNVPIIVITAFGDLQTAVDAVRRGAFDYLSKPFDVEKVQRAVAGALASRSATASQSQLIHVEGMVGRSPAMQEVYKQIALAATSDAAVLLQGESGTGKELAARAIHRFSSRASGPFVAVNVAALSSSLAESELFGHVRGAFTGAEESRIGLLPQASGGTLFLDEVADIPLAIQAKLLRALEYGEVLPVGANEPVQIGLRLLSATHRDLPQRVAEGTFRHDLFFRLCAFSIHLPPLRERPQDIADLAQYFAEMLAKLPGTAQVGVTSEALAELQRRRWCGNVRELRNAIDHALIMARGRDLLPAHLPTEFVMEPTDRQGADATADIVRAVKRWALENIDDTNLSGQLYDRLIGAIEPPLFEVALESHKGQFATAARALGIHRTTLRKKMSEFEPLAPTGPLSDTR